MAKINRLEWARHLCAWMEFPSTKENLFALVAWEAAEGGPNGAKFNPLNTTLDMPGATNFNSTGVKNYKNLNQGLEATSKTLRQHSHPKYAPIRHSLLKEHPAKDTLQALAASEWGTGPFALEILDDVKQYWTRDYAFVPIAQ